MVVNSLLNIYNECVPRYREHFNPKISFDGRGKVGLYEVFHSESGWMNESISLSLFYHIALIVWLYWRFIWGFFKRMWKEETKQNSAIDIITHYLKELIGEFIKTLLHLSFN